MKATMNDKCPFCGSESNVVLEKQLPLYMNTDKLHFFSLRICNKCALGFHASRPEEDVLKTIYDNYCIADPLKGFGVSSFEPYIDIVKKHVDRSDKIIEIGSSSGYLLYRLKQEGFTRLCGIDPAPQSDIAMELGLDIRKEYYDENIFESSSIDGFLLRYVFDVLENPFSIFSNMVKQLSANGKIIIESTYCGEFHHQQLYFYSLPSYLTLADKYDAKIIDFKRYEGKLIVVFAHKNNPAKAMKISENLDEIINDITQHERKKKENIARIKDFLNKHKKVYWWGVGMFTLHHITQMLDSIKASDVTFVDSSTDRLKMNIPLCPNPIHYSELENTEINALVVGCSSPFIKEIQKTMEENNITAKNVVYLCNS